MTESRDWRISAMSPSRGSALISARVTGFLNGLTVFTSTMPKRPEASVWRSEEHTSELQSLMRISYAVFCLKKKKNITKTNKHTMIIMQTTKKHQTQAIE